MIDENTSEIRKPVGAAEIVFALRQQRCADFPHEECHLCYDLTVAADLIDTLRKAFVPTDIVDPAVWERVISILNAAPRIEIVDPDDVEPFV